MKWLENDKMLKLIALCVALVLWLYVGTQKDPISQRTYEVQLEAVNVAVDKTVALSQETVQVRVMGRQDRLNTLSGKDFKATVDLAKAKEGPASLPVKVTLPSAVYFARTEPRNVDVQVSAKDGSKQNVEVVTTGALPDGVSMKKTSVKPKQVFVTGDPDALAMVDHVGVALDLSGVIEDSETSQEVLFYDAAGNLIQGAALEAIPATVTLVVDVDEQTTTKAVPVEATLTGALPAGMVLESASVMPETVNVSGTPKQLARVDSIATEPVDLSQITASTQRTAKLDSTLTLDTASVTVTFVVSETQPEEESKTTTVPLVLTGAAASSVTSDVQQVTVTYHMASGYADAAPSLSATAVVDAVPSGQITAQVQVTGGEGVVIDAVSSAAVTLYPTATVPPDDTDNTTNTRNDNVQGENNG